VWERKTVSHVIIGLKTTKGTKQLKLDPSIYEALQKEKVSKGDVIYIEANSGAVKRVGRSDAYATEFDLEAEDYVPLPKGDVHKKKEVVQVQTHRFVRSKYIFFRGQNVCVFEMRSMCEMRSICEMRGICEMSGICKSPLR